MSTLPPPLPPRPSQSPMQVPGSSAFTPQRAPKFFEGDLVKATPLFIVLAIVVTVISLILAILPTSNVLIAIVGYLLTPFTVMVLMGWDTVSQRKKTSTEAWFVPNPSYSKLLRILAGVSILLSYPHINQIASSISAKLAENIWLTTNFSWFF